MKRYGRPSDELLLGFDGLDAYAIWRQCDVARAE